MAKTPDLISSREACEILAIGRSTLTYWMLTGRIAPAQTIPGPNTKAVTHLFDRADVERLKAA
jgi:predicted site-specific integrase-resolvase